MTRLMLAHMLEPMTVHHPFETSGRTPEDVWPLNIIQIPWFQFSAEQSELVRTFAATVVGAHAVTVTATEIRRGRPDITAQRIAFSGGETLYDLHERLVDTFPKHKLKLPEDIRWYRSREFPYMRDNRGVVNVGDTFSVRSLELIREVSSSPKIREIVHSLIFSDAFSSKTSNASKQ